MRSFSRYDWDYAIPPAHEPVESQAKICCAVIGFIALLIIVNMYQVKSLSAHRATMGMMPAFASSMASAFHSMTSALGENLMGEAANETSDPFVDVSKEARI